MNLFSSDKSLLIIASIIITSLTLFGCTSRNYIANDVSVYSSEWKGNSVSISCVTVDSVYNPTDTAYIRITVRNESSHPIYIDNSIATLGEVGFVWGRYTKIDYSFEWWFSSDPLMTGIGPLIAVLKDSISANVRVPLSRFKLPNNTKDVQVDIFFAYILNIGQFSFLLSNDDEIRRKMDALLVMDFQSVIRYSLLNPVTIYLK